MPEHESFNIDDLDNEFEWIDAEMLNADSKNSSNKDDSTTDLELYRFLASIQQTEFSFYTNTNNINLNFLSENLINNLSFAKSIADEFEYKLNNLTHIYYFNIMLRQISYLSTAAMRTGVSIEDIMKENDYISKIKNINIDGVVILEDELSTNEVSMHIKSVLVPYCIYFDYTVSSQFTNINVSLYLDLVIRIAKNVATKWNKELNINKRHVLFTNVLDTIARFTLENLYKFLNTKLTKKLDNIDNINKTIWDSIEDFSLGLEDYPQEKNKIIDKTEAMIATTIGDFFTKNITTNNIVSKERARLYLIIKSSECWIKFHDSVIAEIKSLDNEQRASYFKANPKIPSTKPYYEILKSNLNDYLTELQNLEVDEKEFSLDTMQKFSTLWGASNAYCNTKK